VIVGTYFESDWNTGLQWQQHNVYDEALQIIVGICRKHVALAIALLQVGWPKRCETDFRFDHRTLQNAHDILAAAWRHGVSPAQTALPLETSPTTPQNRISDWLEWLSVEIRSWRDEPRLIALVFTILSNQNQPIGYHAEDELAELLCLRFANVPWYQHKKSGVPGDAAES